jgi:hypothetical protein
MIKAYGRSGATKNSCYRPPSSGSCRVVLAADAGVHAIQMELACRGYVSEPAGAPSEAAWPTPFDPDFAQPMTATLNDVLQACLDFAARSHP